MIDQVYHFNRNVRGVEQPAVAGQLSPDAHAARAQFLGEEVLEFAHATSPEGELDALIDVIYFAIGGMYEMGLTTDQISAAFSLVHEANMAKAAGKKEGRDVDVVDASKPDGWQEPDLEQFFKQFYEQLAELQKGE